MFIIDESGALCRVKRRPADWDAKTYRGWRFLPENRAWDADERGAVIAAIEPLAAVGSMVEHESDAWLKRRANEHCRSGRLTLDADPD